MLVPYHCLNQCWAVLSFSLKQPVGKCQVYGIMINGSQKIQQPGLLGSGDCQIIKT